jgi:general secretion pathway protein L
VLAAGLAAVARVAANASAGIAAPKVIVALNPRQVLRKEIPLPAAVEENLIQALAYDLDRHTPFRPEQLYFDATVVARDAAKKMLRVDWVAALKTIVDGAKKQVEEWGAVVVAVVPGPPTTTPTRLNLLPNAARPRPLQWRRPQVWAPVALIAAFAIAAVVVPLLQKRQYAIELAELNAAAGVQAQAADKVRQQLERMQNDYNYILAKKYVYPSAVHVLDEVTRVLPDDTWITQLELKASGRGKETQRDLYLRGESGNAGRLIALLEDSKLVELVAPRSPTTKIQGSSGEIFDLGARLRALPAPAAIALKADAVPVNVAAPVAPPPEPVARPTPAAVSEQAPPAAPSAAPLPNEPPSPTTRAGFGPFPNSPVAGPGTAQGAGRAPPPLRAGQAPRVQQPPPAAIAPPLPPAAGPRPGAAVQPPPAQQGMPPSQPPPAEGTPAAPDNPEVPAPAGEPKAEED